MGKKNQHSNSETINATLNAMLKTLPKDVADSYAEQQLEYSKEQLEFFKNDIIEDYNDIKQNNSGLFDLDWNDPKVIKGNQNTITTVFVFYALFRTKTIKSVAKKILTTTLLESTFKWFIPMMELRAEMNRLTDIYPTLNKYLFNFHIFSLIKINIALLIVKKIDKIEGTMNHMQLQTLVDSLYTKRRKSPKTIIKKSDAIIQTFKVFSKKETIAKKKNSIRRLITKKENNFLDHTQNLMLNDLITKNEPYFGKKYIKEYISGHLLGNSSGMMRLLPIDELNAKSKRSLYINLFPLFRLILKDNILYSELEYTEYDAKIKTKKKNSQVKETNPLYSNYSEYKLKNVMTILGKT